MLTFPTYVSFLGITKEKIGKIINQLKNSILQIKVVNRLFFSTEIGFITCNVNK